MKSSFSNNQKLFSISFFGAILLLFGFSFVVKDKLSIRENKANKPDVVSCGPNLQGYEIDYNLEEVKINDNRKPAGEFREGVYYISLEIREGNWYPETKEGVPIKVRVFAETGKPLLVPGPLIRVPEGTEIKAIVTNRLDQPQRIFGFTQRPSNSSDSLVILPNETKEISFNAGAAGTYGYAVTDDIGTRDVPFIKNQAYGALIIDAKDKLPDPDERIIMIGMCGIRIDSNHVNTQFVMNGMSWPFTERLQYRQGEKVKWRIINASPIPHPMHLHGFPFTIHSLGRFTKDSIVVKEKERLAITQELLPGNSMRLSWVPAKPGNWLFHCHLVDHILPLTFLRDQQAMDHASLNVKTHAANGMGGLIMGINIIPDKKFTTPKNKIKERNLTLVIGEKGNYFDNSTGKGFQLWENGKATTNGVTIPGPSLVLVKDQPVAIKVINRLKEATTIHWHGLEIESYYDGVAGWGNMGKRLAPLIQPNDSFTIHITPPRAGTFMYHTHMHDIQLLEGMYGALIVLNPDEKYNPETDKIFVISQGGSSIFMPRAMANKIEYNFGRTKYLWNGTDKPETLTLQKGQTYHFRFINIGAQNYNNTVWLRQGNQFSSWTFLAKDGMTLSKEQQVVRQSRQRIAIGETYDFEFTPASAGDYRFDLLYDSPKPMITQLITVKE
jgi:FtsP/CotA-like multicopper oxidase with cupredoxin domain